jgi:hypothetical protein
MQLKTNIKEHNDNFDFTRCAHVPYRKKVREANNAWKLDKAMTVKDIYTLPFFRIVNAVVNQK